MPQEEGVLLRRWCERREGGAFPPVPDLRYLYPASGTYPTVVGQMYNSPPDEWPSPEEDQPSVMVARLVTTFVYRHLILLLYHTTTTVLGVLAYLLLLELPTRTLAHVA